MIKDEINILQIKNLTKKYPLPKTLFKKGEQGLKYKLALDDVSFELLPGLYGLLGPNGAGKSTLINIITGSLRQNNGCVLYNDKNIRKLDKKFRRILGYMPQQQTLYETFTGKEFLVYMCALKEIPKKQVADEVLRVSNSVNLTQELSKKIGAYSGGMKQRLLAANALLGTPKVLILDEPTAGLDPKERVRLRELMAEVSKTAIVLIATHVVSDVESVADEIIILKEGKIVAMDDPQALIKKYAPNKDLEQVYLNIFGED